MDKSLLVLPTMVSSKNLNYIYENMTEIKEHIQNLEIQFAVYHLLNVFEKFPLAENIYVKQEEIYDDEGNYDYYQYCEVDFFQEALDNDNFSIQQNQSDITEYVVGMLSGLNPNFTDFDGVLNRNNLKATLRDLMGASNFDLWQASIEKEHLEDNVLDNEQKHKIKL